VVRNDFFITHIPVGIIIIDTYCSLIFFVGSGLLRKHGSILGILRQVYPDHEWPEWLVGAPRGFWNSTENQKRFFDWTYTHLNFKSMDDWYTVTQTQLNELGGRTSGLLKHYDGSFKDALKALYPNHTWEDAAFDTPTKKAWDELTTSVQLMDRLKAQFKIENLEEWYNIGTSDIKKAFGAEVFGFFCFETPQVVLKRTISCVMPF
jgi:hypothetical protein